MYIYMRGKDVHETTHVWADEDLFPLSSSFGGKFRWQISNYYFGKREPSGSRR